MNELLKIDLLPDNTNYFEFLSRKYQTHSTPIFSGDDMVLVSLEGDPGDAPTGVENGKPVFSFAGAIYAFLKVNNTWTQQPALVPPERTTDDLFGCSMAISGDTLFVGSHNYGHSVSNTTHLGDGRGAVWVFNRVDNSWQYDKKILDYNNYYQNYHFGVSLSANGNWLAVASIGAINMPSEDGIVSLYHLEDGQWTFFERLYANDPRTYVPGELYRGAKFGSKVILHDDMLLVAAPWFATDGVNAEVGVAGAGAVLFYKLGSDWSRQQVIMPQGTNERQIGEHFGTDIAFDGETLVVSSYNSYDQNGQNFVSGSGAVYIFKRNGNTFTQIQKLVAPRRLDDCRFGDSLSLEGDLLTVAGYDRFDAHESQFPTVTTEGVTTTPFQYSVYLYRRHANTWSYLKKLSGNNIYVSGQQVKAEQYKLSTIHNGIVYVAGHKQDQIGVTWTHVPENPKHAGWSLNSHLSFGL